MDQLKYQPTIFDDEWQPAPRFRNPKNEASEITKLWVQRTREVTGDIPKNFNPYATPHQISRKIKKHSYITVLKIVIFVTSPICKYYQYPFSWKKTFDKALANFEKAKANPEDIREYDGFIGPVGMKKLDSTPKERVCLSPEEINELFPV